MIPRVFPRRGRLAEVLRQIGRPPRRKVFGVGLPKTGTTTLGGCLRTMGYRHHSFDMALAHEAHRHGAAALVERARRFDSFEDWPWFRHTEALADAFPDALFVLTTRIDEPAYLASLRRHRARQGCFDPAFAEPAWWRDLFGHPPGLWDPERFAADYRTHNAAVARLFAARAPERLAVLCWEAGDGWAELCRFLGTAVPDAPFPHLNRAPNREVAA